MKLSFRIAVFVILSIIFACTALTTISILTFQKNQAQSTTLFKDEFLEVSRELFNDSSNLFFQDLNSDDNAGGNGSKNILNSIANTDPNGDNVVVINIANREFIDNYGHAGGVELLDQVTIQKFLDENTLNQISDFDLDNFDKFSADTTGNVIPSMIHIYIYKNSGLLVGYGKTFVTGKARVQFIQSQNQALYESFLKTSIEISLVVLIINAVISLIFMQTSIVGPLKKIGFGISQIVGGNLGAKINIKSRDEMGDIANAFNGMTGDLMLSEQKLKEYSKKLEQKVDELGKANSEINKGWLELQQEKAKLSASIENMPVGFLMIDITGNVLVTNTLVHKILGGKNDSEVYEILKKTLKDRLDIVKYLRECNEDSKTFIDRDIAIPDGRFLKIFLSPILSGDEKGKKKCTGIVVLIDDITEVKITERSRDEFFSIASHELRTPLTAIRGNSSLIKDIYMNKFKDPELTEMVDDIHTSAIRLIDIVNDFLNVSRLEMGKITFKKDEFDLVPVVSAVIGELTEQAAQKNLTLKAGSPDIKTFKVFSDSDRVKEVLVNLVGNAIKYTDKGEINIDFASIKGFSKISVRDTGQGITPEGQKLLFRKFQQAGESLLTRDTTKSTGLGLYISKMIVEGLGGKIWLESTTPGKGSVFSFTVPAKTFL